MPHYNYHSLSDIFSEWGKKKQKIPTNNDAIKEKITAVLRSNLEELPKPKRFPILKGLLVISAGVSILLCILVSPTVRDLLSKPETDIYQNNNITSETVTNNKVDNLGINYGSAIGLDRAANENRALPEIDKKINNIIKHKSPLDTREFLKVGYQADIKTRSVEKLDRQIETMIRGYGGRVDASSSNQENAYISFVIPKSSLESLKDGLKELVPERFYSESLSSRNLLPEKQVIEKQTNNTKDELYNLQKRKQQLINDHNNKISYWQKEINITARDINILSEEVATDTMRQQKIADQIASLNVQKNSLKQKIATENSQYQNNLNRLKNNIANTNNQLEDLNNQDQEILNDVGMVEGSISLNWISIIDIIDLYVPINWVLVIALAVTLITYLLYGRRQKAIVLP